jgi:hypothetical protein
MMNGSASHVQLLMFEILVAVSVFKNGLGNGRANALNLEKA